MLRKGILMALVLAVSCARPMPTGATRGGAGREATRERQPAPSSTPQASSSAPDPRVGTISATATGILVDGRRVCTADATLVDGYAEGCAPARSSANELEKALSDRNVDPKAGHESPVHRAWLLDVDSGLPLVAFHQVVTTLYRANILDFTIAYGGKRRTVTNRRTESILTLHFRANETFRAGVEQGSLQLGPSCPRSYSVLDQALERCIAEVARANLVVFIDVDALPSVPGEKRTVGFLWSILDRIGGDVTVAIL